MRKLTKIAQNIANRPIALGGTGANNITDAADNLNLLTTEMFDIPGGVFHLDSNGKVFIDYIPPDAVGSSITIKGLLSVNIYSQHTYVITNFDIYTTYVISAISGTVSRVGDTITYTASGTPGASGFIINDLAFNINVNFVNQVNTPIISYPSNLAIDVNPRITAVVNPFVNNYNNNTHISTDWQIATDSGFVNIIQESLNDVVNLESFAFNILNITTLYYIRVRFTSSNITTPWSNTVSITTGATFIPSNESAKIVAADAIEDLYIGWNIDISDTGTRIVAGAGNCFYIFIKSGATWVQEAKFIPSDVSSDSGYGFGAWVCISGDGTRIAVIDSNSFAFSGRVHIFKLTDSIWALEATVVGTDIVADNRFGRDGVSIDYDGTRIAVGTKLKSNTGAVYIFVRSGTTWTQEAKLVPPALFTDTQSNFGNKVSLTSVGDRVIIGAENQDADGGAITKSGGAYIFSRSGITWSLEASLLPGDPEAWSNYGTAVLITDDGTRAFVASPWSTIDGNIGNGKVYIYIRSGSTWSLETILYNDDYLIHDGEWPSFGGYSLGSNIDGSLIVVGYPYSTENTFISAGAAYLFSRSGTTWTQEAKLVASDVAQQDWFGENATISANGTTVAIGSGGADPGAIFTAGAIYIYS